MWWIIQSYWIFIAIMFVVIILFAIRYSGTKRMALEVAVALLKNNGSLMTTAHESLPGITVVFNDAITVHYSREKKTDGFHECISYAPSLSTSYLGGHYIYYTDGLVTGLKRVGCTVRPREEVSYEEKCQCGQIMRIVKNAIDQYGKEE